MEMRDVGRKRPGIISDTTKAVFAKWIIVNTLSGCATFGKSI